MTNINKLFSFLSICLCLSGCDLLFSISQKISKKKHADTTSAQTIAEPAPSTTNTNSRQTIPQSNSRESLFQNLPTGTAVYSLSDVHIRECASKECGSFGVLPKAATMYIDFNESHMYYYNGWMFVTYHGPFCFLQNHTNKTGCTWWNENIKVSGWVYSGNLAF